MGMFDDLIAQQPPKQGMFDDLVAQHQQRGGLAGVGDEIANRWNNPQPGSLIGGMGDLYRGARDLGAGKVNLSSTEGADRGVGVAASVLPMSPAATAGRVITRAVRPAPAPTTQALYDSGNAGFNALKNSDVAFAPDAIKGLGDAVHQQAWDSGARPTIGNAPTVFHGADELRGAASRTPAEAVPMPEGNISAQQFRDWQQSQAAGTASPPVPYADVHAVRTLLNEAPYQGPAVAKSGGKDYTLAQRGKNTLDNFTNNPPEGAVVSGDAAKAAQLSRDANADWSAARKGDAVDNAEWRAELQAKASGSGANQNNANRQQVKSILFNDSKTRGWTDPEVAKAETLVTGKPLDNFMRGVGKYAPTGPIPGMGVLASAGGAAMSGHPLVGAGILGGAGTAYAFKKIADAVTKGRIQDLGETVRKNSPLYRSMPSQLGSSMQLDPNLSPVGAMMLGLGARNRDQ